MTPSKWPRVFLPTFGRWSRSHALAFFLFLVTLATISGCKTKPKASSEQGNTAKLADKAKAPDKKYEASPKDPGAQQKQAQKAGAPKSGSTAAPKDPSESGASSPPKPGPQKAGSQKTGIDPGQAKPEPQNPAEKGEAKAKDPSPEKKPKVSNKSLLARVSRAKYSDDKAHAWLKQAKDNGAKARELALAANKRGEALFSKAERAEAFFRWAEEQDPSLPLPAYNRAKLAALRGDIPGVRSHLKTVKERGGKKLLRKVGFDPVFSLVHDDPVVRSMSR